MVSSSDKKKLSKECVVFCHYLVEQGPDEYVVRKYIEAIQAKNLDYNNLTRFEKFLNDLLLKLPLFVKSIDIYCCLFYRNSVIRKKLVQLLAILESCSPTHIFLDTPSTSSRTSFYIQLIRVSLGFSLNGLIAGFMLLPIHLAFTITGKTT